MGALVDERSSRDLFSLPRRALAPHSDLSMEPWIVHDPAVLAGKACVRGTRISVEFLLELVASGASQSQILAAYPQLSSESLAAAFHYAAASLRDEFVWDSSHGS